ncbi:Hydroxyacylglutathione hydrolase [Acaryochloris thomasi RCC1774]|uniref:Hydroxyacylglutathione hydrolase n=1 Tax=Acaryochloris thomasi RCC1774 TaxID=1764569 RepID=A0A2W1JE25_9CYAN|nr:MBL fold metallo-hydrolase [Acaryochloris thomasi]PZD72070.1 Hydroxyacylglutathione hydrolase [Acaryochloris thomasi RCC1774]
MAHLTERRTENVAGEFYVDSTCIDCDTCRWMTPQVFSREAGQSAVYHQPATEQERLESLQALLACPTASIGTVEKPRDIRKAQQSFPLLIEDGVYHCGYHSEKSFGAASYFIQRPEGNVLVDSPRFAPPLVKNLEALGGIRYLYLTHRDDVADHEKFRERFGCDRILHQDDITPATQEVEIQLEGQESFKLAPDLQIIPVPGHTKGHTVLLYQNRFLFTGDHLAWSRTLDHLVGFHRFCWYSWPQQIEAMKRLLDYRFEWVLPGHGRRHSADPQRMQQQLQDCIDWMDTV